MTLWIEALIESSAILALALAALPLLGRRPAALRHAVVAAALACAAIAPVVGRLVPAWSLPAAVSVGPAAAGRDIPSASGRSNRRDGKTDGRKDGKPEGSIGRADVVAALGGAWIAGAGIGFAVLGAGLFRLWRLASHARRLCGGAWQRHAAALSEHYGLNRPVSLLLCAHPSIVVTWGLRRPKVALPASAAAWPEERIRVVLAHELAHVRRGDWLMLLAAEILKCVYWFNPLVWIACARLRRESEHACDDAVINAGVAATAYADHLVDIARELRRRPLWSAAPAIERSSGFERRVQAMLDTRLDRRPVPRAARAAVAAAMLAVTIAIASAQSGFSTLTGSIVDPMQGALPGVTLVLTSTQNGSKWEVRSDGAGRYEFVGLPPGEYLFEARLPGFATFNGRLSLSGQAVQRDLALEIGSLTETITVASSRTNPVMPSTAPPKPALKKRPRPACGSASTLPTAVRVGGNIRAPVKLRDVRPVYPVHLATAGVEGTVVLKGSIGEDGMVADLSVVSSSNPELAAAAADAVRQWEFDETLLNCKPIAVTFTANVSFALR